MPDQNHEGRTVLTAKIDEQISRLTTVVQNEIKNNLSTRNVVAETILAGLLNRIHGWNLINANRIRANYPAVDLVDQKKRVAVQVSSTCDLGKVDHTLEEFQKNHLEDEYDKLYILTISTANSTETMQKRAISGIFSGKEDIWNMPKLTGQLMDLDIAVLEDIHRYLTLELGRFDPLGRYLHLPAPGSLGDGFVGRQEELESIQQQLNLGIKPVVLRGLGGMGKTVLAAEYARNHCQGMVYFAHFLENFTETVRNMYQGVQPRTKDAPRDQEKLDTVLQLLERCTEDDLLIIDNLDSGSGTLPDLLKDPVYKQLQQMKLRLLITTRFEYRGAIQINRLDDDALYQIFRRHEAPVTKPEMDALIRAVSGHTLAIDLIARTLADNWVPVSSEEMLDALEKNTLSDADFAEIDSDYGNSPEQKQIYKHLQAVFNVAKVPDPERAILHYATLLPEGGMDVRLFRSCLSKDLLAAFPLLGKRGWLISDGSLLRIHPIIRMVCREELKPSDESCGEFLQALWKQYDQTKYDTDRYSQLADTFAAAADQLEDQNPDWINHAGEIYCELKQANQAKALYDTHLMMLEERFPGQAPLATAYNFTGHCLSDLGYIQTALEFLEKSLKIRLDVLTPDDPDLALSYNNVGYAYGEMGDHKKALEYKLKALEIREKVLSPDHPDLAASCNNVGHTYGDLGDHKKALEYQMKALEIRETVLPPNHPDLAASYNNVGYTYGEMGDHKQALKYQMKALEIWEKVLPPDHPDLAASYNNLGYTCGEMGKWEQALYYLRKALVICEKKFPKYDKQTQAVQHSIQKYQKQLQMQQNMAKAGFNFDNPFVSLIPPKK